MCGYLERLNKDRLFDTVCRSLCKDTNFELHFSVTQVQKNCYRADCSKYMRKCPTSYRIV